MTRLVVVGSRLSITDHRLRSRAYANVVVAQQWLHKPYTVEHGEDGPKIRSGVGV
jgi:hypothetical protein